MALYYNITHDPLRWGSSQSLGHSTLFPGDISTLLTLTLLRALPVLILANVSIHTNDTWNTSFPSSKCLVLHLDLRHLFLWSQHRLIITNHCQTSITCISSVPLPDTYLLSAYSLKYTKFNSTVTIILSQMLISTPSNFQLFPSMFAFFSLKFYYYSLLSLSCIWL